MKNYALLGGCNRSSDTPHIEEQPQWHWIAIALCLIAITTASLIFERSRLKNIRLHKQLFKSLAGDIDSGALSPVSDVSRQNSTEQRLQYPHRPKDRGKSRGSSHTAGTLTGIRERKSDKEYSDQKSDMDDDEWGNNSLMAGNSSSGSESRIGTSDDSTQTGGRSIKFTHVETVEYEVNSPIPPSGSMSSPDITAGRKAREELAALSIFSEEDVTAPPHPEDGLKKKPSLPGVKTKSPSSLGSASTTLSMSTRDHSTPLGDDEEKKGGSEDDIDEDEEDDDDDNSGEMSSTTIDSEDESSVELRSRKRHHSHRKTVSMLGPSVVLSRSADLLIADPNSCLMDTIDDNQLLNIHGDKRTNVLSFYQTEFKKAKRKGENYSTKHDNELMDHMLRHLTMRVDHDHGPFLESNRSSLADRRHSSVGNSQNLSDKLSNHVLQPSNDDDEKKEDNHNDIHIDITEMHPDKDGRKVTFTAEDARKATGFGGSASSSLTAYDIASNGEIMKLNTWRVMTTQRETRPILSLEEFRYYRKERELAVMKYRWIVWFPVVHLLIAALVQATVNEKSVKRGGYNILLYLLPLLEVVDCGLIFLLVQVIVLSCGGRKVVAESLDCIIAANNVTYDYINQRARFGCPIPLIRATSAKRLYNWLIDLIKMISGILVASALALPIFDGLRLRKGSGGISQLDLILRITLYVFAGLWFTLVLTVISLVVSISQLLAPLSSLSEKSLSMKTLVICAFFFTQQIGFISLLVAELENERCQSEKKITVLMSGSFYLIVTYINVICFSISNVWAFSTADFELWGKSTLAKPSISHLVTDQVDWELIEDDRHFKEENWEFVPPSTLRPFYDKTFGNPAMVRVTNLRQNLTRSDSTRHLIIAPSRNSSPRNSHKLLNNNSSSGGGGRKSKPIEAPKFPTVSSNSDTLIGFDSGSEDQMIMEPNTSRLAPVDVVTSSKKRMSKEDTLKYMVRINSGNNESDDDEDEDDEDDDNDFVERSVEIKEESSDFSFDDE